MVKFERVKDPDRAKPCDLLVFPAGNEKLKLKPSTLSKYGLSVGQTCRASNALDTVRQWFHDGVGPSRRVFAVAAAMHKAPPAKEELLLGLDATAVHVPDEVQPITRAELVPFGPDGFGSESWDARQWAGAWDAATGGAVVEAVRAAVGADGCVPVRGRAGSPDECMSQTWDADTDRLLRGLTDADRDSTVEDWFPTVAGAGPDACAFSLDSVMHWVGGWYDLGTRVMVRPGFLGALVAKGAALLRPNGEFVAAVTADVAAWWMADMRNRFLRRSAAGADYARRLKEASRNDARRAGKYAAAVRRASAAYRRSKASEALAAALGERSAS